MRTATSAVALLVLFGVTSVPRTAAADTALGRAKWSVELGTILGQTNDASLAIRCHSGASSAFRLGIQVFVQNADGNDGTITQAGSPDVKTTVFNQINSNTLSIQWMRFAPIRDNVTATFAVGPVVQMGKSAFRQESGVGDPSFTGFENSAKTTLYGLDLGLGVEWFFNSRVSLGASTALRAMMGKSKYVQVQRSGTGSTYAQIESEIEADITQISTGTGRIQLTGYF